MTRHSDPQRQHWDAVAAGWSAWLPWTSANFQPITAWFDRMSVWRPGTRVLDLACGAGYPALEGAARVLPEGTLVASDVSAAMVAAAAAQARSAGLEQLRFVVADSEALPYGDEFFDGVTNAYGLMFCGTPEGAIGEAFRVLKPGGRFAATTWDDSANSPFFSVIHSVAAPRLGLAVPQPDAPGPFRLASPRRLDRLLRDAGFGAVTVERGGAVFELRSVAEYLRMFGDLAWKRRIQSLTEAARAALERDLHAAAAPFVIDGTLRLTATSLCASGRKPLRRV